MTHLVFAKVIWLSYMGLWWEPPLLHALSLWGWHLSQTFSLRCHNTSDLLSLLREGWQFQWFALGLAYYYGSYSIGQETNMMILSDATYTHPYYAIKVQGNEHRWVTVLVRFTLSRTPFIFLHPWTLTLIRCHGGVCGFMVPMSALMLVQKSWAFLFPKFIFTLLNSHQPFGGRIRIIATDFCCYIAESFLRETSLQSMGPDLEPSIFIPRFIFFWFLLLYICQSL